MRKKIVTADIIFMSYNYVFNDIFRYMMKIGPLLKDSIIIIDEAHNILNLCEDSKTSSIDYKHVLDSIEKMNKDKNILELIETENYKKIKEKIENILEYLEIIKRYLLEFYEENKNEFNATEYFTINKETLLYIFDSEIIDGIIIIIEQYLKFLSTKYCTNKKLKKILNFINFLTSIKNQENDDFMFNVSLITKKRKTKKNTENDINFRINIYCFNPSLEFGEILAYNPYRIILTSGTLSPFDFFESQLNHNFYIKYQGNHIIKNDQLIFKLITNYRLPKENPTNKEYHTFYFSHNTNNIDFQYKILGYLLNDLCRVTPGGILIFFTSFQKLNDCLSVWINEGLYEKINSIKNIVYEKNKKSNFFELFKNNIDKGNGSIYFSVFRGKISEGINFNNNYARMLINVGIPFIYSENAKFYLKKEYFENKKEDFNQWYKNDAFFAMNQSCGRIIRDKDDYGVILNIDKRNQDNINLFSGWLKNTNPQCEEYNCNLNENFENNIENNKFIQEIEKFYKMKEIKKEDIFSNFN